MILVPFKELDLGLSLKLNLQENIPWYAAILEELEWQQAQLLSEMFLKTK